MTHDNHDKSQPHPLQPDWPLKNRALNVAAEGITINDQSLPDQPLIYVNEGFERLTGYTASEVLGRNCRFLQGPDTDPKTAQTIREALKHQRECTVEILNYRKDGTTFWNRLSLTPVRNEHGQVTNYIGVQSNVTAQRNAEDNLRQANQRILAGLEAGARIQQALLPQSPPDVKGFEIAWQFLPCDELAGDIFNVFRLDDRHIVMYLLDVVGHGVPAALLSVTLSHFLSPGNQPDTESKDNTPFLASPLKVVNWLNQQFPFDMQTGQFFTILYGVLDVSRKEFRYVTAGHPPLIHVNSSGQANTLHAPGFPVGVDKNPGYEQHAIELSPGERIFMVTDGMLETPNPNGVSFGRERLLNELSCTRKPLHDLLADTLQAVQKWSGRQGLEDDASILGVRVANRDETNNNKTAQIH